MTINGVEIELDEGLELVVEDGGKRLIVRRKAVAAPVLPSIHFIGPIYPPQPPATPLRVEPLHPIFAPVPSTASPFPQPLPIYCGNDLTVTTNLQN